MLLLPKDAELISIRPYSLESSVLQTATCASLGECAWRSIGCRVLEEVLDVEGVWDDYSYLFVDDNVI